MVSAAEGRLGDAWELPLFLGVFGHLIEDLCVFFFWDWILNLKSSRMDPNQFHFLLLRDAFLKDPIFGSIL